jgi:hypothetical protein
MSTESPFSTGAFSGSDDPAQSYRPISPMAVVSLLLGIASLGAFFAGVLWLIPPIALVVGAMTSRRLEKAREEYAGQFISKVGVLFAVIALFGAPTIYYTKRFVLGRESRAIADAFLDRILENKLKLAYAYTARPDMQAEAQDDPEEIQKRRGREPFQMFIATPTVSQFGGKGAEVQVTHSGYWYDGADRGIERVMHQYLFTVYNAKDEVTGVFSVPVIISGAVGAEWPGRKWMVEVHQVDPYEPKKSKMAMLRAFGG